MTIWLIRAGSHGEHEQKTSGTEPNYFMRPAFCASAVSACPADHLQ